MSTHKRDILTHCHLFAILDSKKYYCERTKLVLEQTMPVRSRLKIVLAEYNTALIRAGHNPLTVRALAHEINLSPSVITGLTSNRASRVDFETLNKLCKRLGCTPGDILEYVPDPE